jgi:hypothetical protein
MDITANANYVQGSLKVGGYTLGLETSRDGVTRITITDTFRKVGQVRQMLIRRDQIKGVQHFLNEALLFSQK